MNTNNTSTGREFYEKFYREDLKYRTVRFVKREKFIPEYYNGISECWYHLNTSNKKERFMGLAETDYNIQPVEFDSLEESENYIRKHIEECIKKALTPRVRIETEIYNFKY